MAILWTGSHPMDFRIDSSPANYTITSSSSYIDTQYSRWGFRGGSSSASMAWADVANQTEFWLHFHMCTPNVMGNSTIHAKCLDSATGNSRVQIENTASVNYFRLGYWNGSSFTYLTPTGITSLSQYEVDVHVKLHASTGVVELYINGTLNQSFSGNTSAIATSFNSFGFGNTTSSDTYSIFFSQIILADASTNTVGLRLADLAPASVGDTSQWTNGNAPANLIDALDTTTINIASANQIQEYNLTAPLMPNNNFNVVDVCVSARVMLAAAGPQNLQLGVRDHDLAAETWGSNLSGLSTSYLGKQVHWATNPNNSNANWTMADIAANKLQIGVKSIA
jgi:hypothetical protein